MPVLIDGDNLLHAARGALPGTERANRAWLCRLLVLWDPTGRENVTVYFDGFRPGNPGEGPVATGPLSVHYSESRTADDLIAEAVEASSAPRRLTVVSSDRQVRSSARRRRAVTVDSARFIEQVLKRLRRSRGQAGREPPEKYKGLDPGDAEYWFGELGIDDDIPDIPPY